MADGTVPVLTGIASLGVEPRTPEDIAAFGLPPVGYDPYMFCIEPEPLRDRRPAERTLRPDRRAPPRSRHFPRGADCGACHQQRAAEPGAAGRCGSRGALDARDLLARDAAFRTTWDFGGGFGVFLETGIDDRSCHTPAADGLSRSSTGEQYRAGLAFAPLSNIIRGEVSLGWGRQRPNEAALPELDGVLIDANLAWRASPLTSFLLTAQSTFVDSIAFASSGGLARRLGLEARHAFQCYLIGSAGVRYTTTPYAGIPLRESELIGELGLDYYLGPTTILFGRYQHIAFDSTPPASQSDTDVLRLGVRLRY
jgi:hypothetical protein